jgi:hypothetical protein
MTNKLRSSLLASAALAALAVAQPAMAHVTWTQPNQYDATAIAMYSLEETTLGTGDTLAPKTGWGTERNLVIQAPTGTGFSSVPTSAYGFLGNALRMDGAQRADTLNIVGGNFGYDDPSYTGPDTNGSLPGDNTLGPDLVDKDVTIEFWLRWDPAPSASSIEIGFRSGSKLRITRDTVTPANDQFAIFATHGTFVSAPGFTNWVDVGVDEAPLGDWIHFAVAIDSTGSTFDVNSNHHKYNAGSVARFYINGHAFGNAPHTVPIDGTLDIHAESSLLTIRNISGAVTIDEVAIWSADLSDGGTVSNPFANGRGTGVPLSVRDWQFFE